MKTMASRFTSRSNLQSANNTTLELQQDLARSTPQQCVTLTHSVPSVQMYCALRTKLDNCSENWLQEFLYLDGLDSLLDSLYQMSARSFTCISDAILQMDCISCVRCILNNTFGLEFFINSDVCTKKLTMALNCNETLPKKQVFEMLSAVCVFSNIGYLRVMEGLSYIKNECDQLHRFSMVVRDLQKCETVAFKTAVMTFINTVINCTPTVMERMRIRNEFIGLNLLDMLSYIRREERDDDLLLQLEVFHERKLSDEESISANNSIDLNSPQDLQDQIQARVFGTPKMANFVNILQDLLAIETVYKDNSGKLWQTVDNLIHHVIHTVSASDLDNIQAELLQFPEQFALGLQCVFSYQDTVKLSSATSRSAGSGENMCASKLFSQTSKQCLSQTFTKDQNVGNVAARGSGIRTNGNINLRRNFNNCSLGSTGSHNSSSASGQSEHSDNSESQNRTVTIFRHNMSSAATCQDEVSSASGIDDKTVVLRNKYCSPTELTFFSNKLDDSQNSPLNNCSKSSEDSSSSPYNADLSCSISSKLSKESHGNKTLNKSDDSKQCGMNINLSESKAYQYDQQKIKNKLDGFCCSLQEDLKTNHMQSVPTVDSRSESSLKHYEGKSVRGTLVEKCCRDQKPSNSIVRQELPKPTRELNHLKWISLTDDKIVGREPCVWLPPIINEKTTPDYQKLETAFQIKSPEHLEAIEEVVLLNANTRLQINLFLSRLDSGAEDLVQHLEEGDQTRLTLPMLQYLSKILPCTEEIEMLRKYKGPRLELGMAEQFVLLLSDVPDYSVMLEGHMMQWEFNATVKQFRMSLDMMINLAKLILNCTEFKQLMHLILNVGNYLNYGQFHGDAAGFKLSSLERLQEVKCLSPNKTLVHCIVQTVADRCKTDLSFVKQFLPLEKAASFSMEEMKADISKLNGKLRYFMSNLTQVSSSLQKTFQPFVEDLKKEFGSIPNATTELRTLTDDLAAYFCEDETRFNIQDCFKCVISFCKDIQKCQNENVSSFCRQQMESKRTGDTMQKKLKSKLLSLEFGQNAGASSSMMEEKTKVLEKIVTQLHQGNFNPCIKSELPTPDKDPAHPLEMSCITFVGSPSQPRGRLGTGVSDNVFLDTPELVCASYGSANEPKLMRSSTQKLLPVKTTCTAQTVKPVNQSSKPNYMPSPITADTKHAGKKSATLQRKLFPLTDGNEEYQEREITDKKADGKVKRQLELPSRKTMHRRSRSDMVDSICGTDKWIEYEKTREQGGRNAPLAEPESVCNLSILNLENRGKFVTNKDIAVLKSDNLQNKDVCSVEDGPVIRLPEAKGRKGDKKSSVGGFFTKLGRAVLKPRNVYSDGDQYVVQAGKPVKERKKSISSEKENVDMDPMPSEDRQAANDKRNKADGNTNKVSRFFQRGGLYRSSKMKKKNQNVAQ